MLRPVDDRTLPEAAGLQIEEVRDEMQLRAYELAMVRGFEATELEGQGPGSVFPTGVLHDGRLGMWVDWADDRPVSAAAAFVESGVTNVMLFGTVPEARRRGFGVALTWRATLADPDLPVMLLAISDGRPVYERMGFLPLFRFAVWYRDRPESA
jgi:GNAT superfamily N-acetyltransferase